MTLLSPVRGRRTFRRASQEPASAGRRDPRTSREWNQRRVRSPSERPSRDWGLGNSWPPARKQAARARPDAGTGATDLHAKRRPGCRGPFRRQAAVEPPAEADPPRATSGWGPMAVGFSYVTPAGAATRCPQPTKARAGGWSIPANAESHGTEAFVFAHSVAVQHGRYSALLCLRQQPTKDVNR